MVKNSNQMEQEINEFVKLNNNYEINYQAFVYPPKDNAQVKYSTIEYNDLYACIFSLNRNENYKYASYCYDKMLNTITIKVILIVENYI